MRFDGTRNEETGHWLLSYAVFTAAIVSIGVGPAVIGAVAGLEGAGKLVVLHLVTTAFLAAFLAGRSVRAGVFFLAVLMPWQPFLSMPFAGALGSPGIRLLVATKEVYAAVFVSALFLKNAGKIKWNKADMAAILFLLAYVFYFVKSPAGMTSRVVSFKEGFMIACFYFIGRFSLLTRQDLLWFLRAVLVVALLVASFGFLERLVFDSNAWRYIGAVDYLQSKIDTSQFGSVVLNGLPLNWYTYLGNEPVRRMVGPIGDATSLSRFLALPVISLLYVRGLAGASPATMHVRALLLVLLGSALALTLGRGGQIIVIGGLIVLMTAKRPVLSLAIGTPLFVLFLAKLSIFDMQSGSAIRHMAGLAKGFFALYAAPLGNGLGTSGQMAVLYSAKVGEKVSESYIGSLAYQMGAPGVLAYTVLFLTLTLKSFMRYLRLRPVGGRDASLALMAFTFAGGIYVTSVFANSAIAPISAGLSLIYLGAFDGVPDDTSIINTE